MFQSIRSTTCVLLALLGLLVLTVATPLVWAQRQVLDTDRFSAAVGPLIETAQFQEALASQLTQAIVERTPHLSSVVPALERALTPLVASDAFASAWNEAVRISHQRIIEAIGDQGTGLLLDDGVLAVELGPLVDSLRPRLSDAGFRLAFLIPEVSGTFVLAESDALRPVSSTARFVEDWAMPLIWGAAFALLGAVLLARQKTKALGLVAAGVVASMALVLVALALARSRYLSEVESAELAPETAGAVFNALTASLQAGAQLVAGAALLITFLALLTQGFSSRRAARVVS